MFVLQERSHFLEPQIDGFTACSFTFPKPQVCIIASSHLMISNKEMD